MSSKNNPEAPFEPVSDWEQRYHDRSTRWERGALNPAFLHWLEKGAFENLNTIIVPGCGRSPEPLALAKMNINVSALDFAPTAIDFQKKAFEGAHLQGRIEAVDVLQWCPKSPVDAVYDQTCLCALTPAVWPDYEQQLHRWLKPGGQAFMLFMQTGREGGPPFHCAMDVMQGLFADTRWHWPQNPPFNAEHSSGKVEIGVVLTRR